MSFGYWNAAVSVLLLVPPAGCGGSSSTAGEDGSPAADAGRTTIRPDATGLGTVALSQAFAPTGAGAGEIVTSAVAMFVGGVPPELLAGLSFSDPSGSVATALGCTVTSEEACSLISCPNSLPDGGVDLDAGMPMRLDAGRITIRGGPLPAAGWTLEIPAGDNDYSNVQDTTLSWVNGEPLDFAGSGGTGVPAFMASLRAPARIDVTSPTVDPTTPLTVSRDADLRVAWTGGAGSQGHVLVQLLPADLTANRVAVTCAFDPSAGEGTVRRSLLQAFPVSTGNFLVGSQRLEIVAAGDIDVVLQIDPFWINGTFSLP